MQSLPRGSTTFWRLQIGIISPARQLTIHFANCQSGDSSPSSPPQRIRWFILPPPPSPFPTLSTLITPKKIPTVSGIFANEMQIPSLGRVSKKSNRCDASPNSFAYFLTATLSVRPTQQSNQWQMTERVEQVAARPWFQSYIGNCYVCGERKHPGDCVFKAQPLPQSR